MKQKLARFVLMMTIFWNVKEVSAQTHRAYTTVLKYLQNQTPTEGRMIPSCIDGKGNVIITGIKETLQNKNILVQKLNPKGIVLWEYEFESDNHGDDWVSDVLTDNSENIYVCGSVVYKTQNQQNALIFKLSPNGNLHWKQEISARNVCSNYLPFYHFTKMNINKQENRIILSGNMTSSIYIDHLLDKNLQELQDTVKSYGMIEQARPNGNVDWVFCRSSYHELKTYLYNTIILPGNRVYSLENCQDTSGSKYIQLQAFSINSNSIIWEKKIYGNQSMNGLDIQAKGQFLYISGNSDLREVHNLDFSVLKIDRNNGALKWIYTLNGSTNTQEDVAKEMILIGNDIYVCGEVNHNIALVKLNQNGIEKLKVGYFGDKNDYSKKSKVSGMVYSNGFFWVSGFAYGGNSNNNQFVIQWDPQGNLQKNYQWDMGNASNSFPIIQGKNITSDSSGNVWVLGAVDAGNQTFYYPVYRITDFYKDTEAFHKMLSSKADTLSMSLSQLSQDTHIQSLVSNYLINHQLNKIDLNELEMIYPDLSLKMSESLTSYGLSNQEVSNFMNHFRHWNIEGYHLIPYISIPQIDTSIFDYLCWDRIFIKGVAKFVGSKDSIPLFFSENGIGKTDHIFLKTQEDYERFWLKPVWQLAIQFVDIYNNQKVNEFELEHPTIGFRPKATCYCSTKDITDPNNGTCVTVGYCYIGGKGCGKETTNAGSNNCSGLDACKERMGITPCL